MASRNSLIKFQNIVSQSMAGNITSAVTSIEYLNDIGFELDWTGTPVGTFAVQVSASYSQDSLGNVTNAGTWNALNLSPTPSAAGAAGSYYLDLADLSAPWIRVVYTASSGTGTLNGYICGKSK